MQRIIRIFFLLCMTLSLGFQLRAQQAGTYVFEKKIPLEGDGGYDYITLDATHNTLYVSHGTRVHVLDLTSGKEVGSIQDMKGVHGVAIAHQMNKGFITDGKASSMVAFELGTYKKLATIPLESPDADAIVYDSFSQKVFSFNGDGKNVTVVDPVTLKRVGSIELGGTPEFAVADGKGKIYNNLEDKNELITIDSKSMKVVATYPLSPCGGPTGLALDEVHQRLFTVCRENKGMSVVDVSSGQVILTVPIGPGVDAVAYDPSTHFVFCSCGDGTTVIFKQHSADHYALHQVLKTPFRAKTMALDLKTHKIYLSAPQFEANSKKIKPGSFAVYVYQLKG